MKSRKNSAQTLLFMDKKRNFISNKFAGQLMHRFSRETIEGVQFKGDFSHSVGVWASGVVGRDEHVLSYLSDKARKPGIVRSTGSGNVAAHVRQHVASVTERGDHPDSAIG